MPVDSQTEIATLLVEFACDETYGTPEGIGLAGLTDSLDHFSNLCDFVRPLSEALSNPELTTVQALRLITHPQRSGPSVEVIRLSYGSPFQMWLKLNFWNAELKRVLLWLLSFVPFYAEEKERRAAGAALAWEEVRSRQIANIDHALDLLDRRIADPDARRVLVGVVESIVAEAATSHVSLRRFEIQGEFFETSSRAPEQ